jgi:DNA polymerase (family X)
VEKKRYPLGIALPLAREIERQLHAVFGSAHASIAGSVRRRQETIGDLNFVVAAQRAFDACGAFASLPEVARIGRRGRARIGARLQNGMTADLHVVPESGFGAALICFTGSAAHHRALRHVARRQKLELNEYGLFRRDRMIAGHSEADVYRALGLAFVPPELREDGGEIDAACRSALPALIQHGDLQGDLRVYADAQRPAAIRAIVDVATRAGLEYVGLTAVPLRGRSRAAEAKRLLEHASAVRAWHLPRPGLRLLAGAEAPVRKDGSLALDDAVLAEFDVVTAVIRDPADRSRAETTRRIVRAMENPHVDLLVLPAIHPAPHDLEAVIAAAKRTGTALEIEARSDGLGLRGDDVRKALDAGVRLAIGSGAREPEQLVRSAEFGVALARRGWARRSDVLNAFPLRQCLCQLKDGRRL